MGVEQGSEAVQWGLVGGTLGGEGQGPLQGRRTRAEGQGGTRGKGQEGRGGGGWAEGDTHRPATALTCGPRSPGLL